MERLGTRLSGEPSWSFDESPTVTAANHADDDSAAASVTPKTTSETRGSEAPWHAYAPARKHAIAQTTLHGAGIAKAASARSMRIRETFQRAKPS
jgi:hypothetical protein